jgi:NADP-dependent 3-hydroxy acid dehydrogenase YdfG
MSTKVAFITGATAGFGEATARRFVKEGWKVIITGRRTERLEALQADLGKDVCHPVTLDVTDRKGVEACFANLPEGFKEIDVLVNNAGLALGVDSVDQGDVDSWEQMIDTNIKGLLYVTRAALPSMVSRGSGHVVNLGSIAGEWPYPGGNVYGGTKAFVRIFSQNMRADLVAKNINVTDIEPGLAVSEFSNVRFKGDAEAAANVYKGTQPLTPEDIADAIFWTVSRPKHVNINRMEIMPTCQALAGLKIVRDDQ